MSNIVRVQHDRERPYAILSKALLEDSRLSFRARGILAYLLAKPDDWEARMCDVENKGAEGREAVRAAFAEARKFGYMKTTVGNGKGGLAYQHTVYERPLETPCPLPVQVRENRQQETVNGNPTTATRRQLSNQDQVTQDEKRKDMSSDDDAPAPSGSESSQNEQQGASGTHRAVTVGQAPSEAGKGQAKAVKDVPGAAAAGEAAKPDPIDALSRQLVAIWNENRGTLPEVRVKPGEDWISPARRKQLKTVIKNLGEDEAAALWLDAVREVAKDKYWQDSAYGLENLCRHAEAKAAAYRAKQGRNTSSKTAARDGYDGKGWV